jgi:single-stranded DNA-specific DHH superfamily exonuclease
MEHVARALAPKILAGNGFLLIAADNDATGIAAASAAMRAAMAAGLRFDHNLIPVDLGEHHDVADAYAAGWRWSWSS